MQCDRQNLTTIFIHPPFPTHSKYILQVRAVYKTATAVFETLKCIPGLKGYKPLYTMKSLLVQKEKTTTDAACNERQFCCKDHVLKMQHPLLLSKANED